MLAPGVSSVIPALVLALLVGLTALPVFARGTPWAPGEVVEPGIRARAEQLTTELVRAHVRYHLAALDQKPRLERDLLMTARMRERLLLQLTETDAAEVLRLALPTHIRRSFPAGVRTHLEEHVDVEGTLEILDEAADTGRTHYRLDTAIGALTLHFARDDEPDHFPPGARLRVKGIRVRQALAADGRAGSLGRISTLRLADRARQVRGSSVDSRFARFGAAPHPVAPS
jgi:hypothetical protein